MGSNVSAQALLSTEDDTSAAAIGGGGGGIARMSRLPAAPTYTHQDPRHSLEHISKLSLKQESDVVNNRAVVVRYL